MVTAYIILTTLFNALLIRAAGNMLSYALTAGLALWGIILLFVEVLK